MLHIACLKDLRILLMMHLNITPNSMQNLTQFQVILSVCMYVTIYSVLLLVLSTSIYLYS